MNQCVIGFGEIGRAVGSITGDHYVVDVDRDNPMVEGLEMDVMHVCFPYSEVFIREVDRYTDMLKPKHIIIWSTVPIGTTTQIPLAVHSPVEGKHPALAESIEMMERWIGYNDEAEGQWFNNYFTERGLKVRTVADSCWTEALKLLSTTEYGINIVFAAYKAQVAEALDMDYQLTKDWNLAYNSLYRNLGMEKTYQKFVLDAPEGKIGGHCIRENTFLLEEQFPNEMLKIIQELGL